MSPLFPPLRPPEQKESNYQREQRLFAARVRAARQAQQEKRAALLKRFFKAVFKRKGRGTTAPRLVFCVRLQGS